MTESFKLTLVYRTFADCNFARCNTINTQTSNIYWNQLQWYGQFAELYSTCY